ncbi:MAG: hypothetical protein ACREOO_03010 [bacterium]
MLSSQQNQEFYIGYLPQAPNGVAQRVRRFIFAASGLAALVALLLVLAQKPFAASFFEFLQSRAFTGYLLAKPHPTLSLLRPGKTGELPSYSRYYLVGEGKFGIDEEAAKWDGKLAHLRGKLIYRGDQTMIEVESGSIQAQPSLPVFFSPPAKGLGAFTLRGEIVDSKCFLGVMNPGDMKTHKACAVRCIAGGSPPVLVVPQGENLLCLLLLSAEGQHINQAVLEYVARPVEISGEVWQVDNLLTLRADPAKYRVLD